MTRDITAARKQKKNRILRQVNKSLNKLLTAHLENSIEPYTKKFKSSKKRKERKAYLERLYANPKAVGLMNVLLAGAYCEPLWSKVEESLDKARAFNEESNGLNDEALEKLEEREQYLDEHGDAWQKVSDKILDWMVSTEPVDPVEEFKDMMQDIEENQDELQECECE